jgi:hypothetical protein
MFDKIFYVLTALCGCLVLVTAICAGVNAYAVTLILGSITTALFALLIGYTLISD